MRSTFFRLPIEGWERGGGFTWLQQISRLPKTGDIVSLEVPTLFTGKKIHVNPLSDKWVYPLSDKWVYPLSDKWVYPLSDKWVFYITNRNLGE